jgi:hypothetical protein
MRQLARHLLALALLVCPLFAQDKDLNDRVSRLEKLLNKELARGEARDDRIRELEEALKKSTEALAHSRDRRKIEAEIEDYLERRLPEPTTGPSSSRLSIGGVIVGSYRFTEFSGSSSQTNTFQVEERYLRFIYRFSDTVTSRYYTNGSLAELEWHHSDLIQFNFGVIVVPFGQFNQRSFPDTFETLSRPLLYLGDEDIFVTPANNPTAVFRSIYSDTGVVFSGSLFGEEGSAYDQIYYALFITNGLVGVGDLAGGSAFSDNNDNKQIGIRVTFTTSQLMNNVRLGVGGSWMSGKYDLNDSLSYRMAGVDLLIVIDNVFARGEGTLTVRAEFVYAPREILAGTLGDPTTLINDASRVMGAYVIVEARIDTGWMVYVEVDWLRRDAPLLTAGLIDPANPDDVKSRILRYSIGIVRKFEIGIVWKFEYAYWNFDQGAPNAHRLSTQIVVPF